MPNTFKTNGRYNFDVYPSAVLGNNYKNVTVQAVFNYQTALAFADVNAIQANVYAYLPIGTPNRPEDYEYVLITTAMGQRTVLARQWIDEASIAEVGNSKAVVTIAEVGSADIENIRAALIQNGFDMIDVRIVAGA